MYWGDSRVQNVYKVLNRTQGKDYSAEVSIRSLPTKYTLKVISVK